MNSRDEWEVTPGPVVYDSVFHMIYNGLEADQSCRAGYATSPDGVHWTKAPDPVLDLGTWDKPQVQTGSLLYDRSTSQYLLFYGGGDWFKWKISYATTTDLSGPWAKSDVKVVEPEASSWDNLCAAFPCVLYDSTSKQHMMWYMGGGRTVSYMSDIGYAYANNISNVAQEHPANFGLSQNYPNPYNPGTTIRFVIRKYEFVELKVYDVLGRIVRTLVNGKKTPGAYEVKYDASGLPSGVYFYRLTAGAYTSTKKMLLVK